MSKNETLETLSLHPASGILFLLTCKVNVDTIFLSLLNWGLNVEGKIHLFSKKWGEWYLIFVPYKRWGRGQCQVNNCKRRGIGKKTDTADTELHLNLMSILLTLAACGSLLWWWRLLCPSAFVWMCSLSVGSLPPCTWMTNMKVQKSDADHTVMKKETKIKRWWTICLEP